jgi:hypothetical protein
MMVVSVTLALLRRLLRPRPRSHRTLLSCAALSPSYSFCL